MKPNPHCPLLQCENLSHLLCRQILHIVQHKNNAQRCGNTQNSLMKKMILFALQQVPFRALPGILQQTAQLLIARHQFIQG